MRLRVRFFPLALVLVVVAVSLPLGDWPFQSASATDTPTNADVFAGDAYTRSPNSAAGGQHHYRLGLVSDAATANGVHRAGWDLAPGATATLTFNMWVTGLTPPAAPDGDGTDTCVGEVMQDNGATVQATLFTGATCPANGATFGFASSAAGTFRIRVRVVQSDELVDNYNINSDNGGIHDKGALRFRLDVSAMTHDGYPAGAVHAYTVAGEAMSFTTTHTAVAGGQVGAVTFRSLDAANGVVKSNAEVLAAASTSKGTAFTVDDAYAAASALHGLELDVTGNAALTGIPWASIGTATAPVASPSEFVARRAAFVAVDPRVTATHLLQLDNSFGTPPMSEDIGTTRASTYVTYHSTRFTNARAEGLAGASFQFSVLMRDDALVTPIDARSQGTGLTIGTQGGEAGWDGLRLWSEGAPLGAWTKTVDVTAPAAIDSDTHLLAATQAYTLAAPDDGAATMGDPLKLFISHHEAVGGQTVTFVASEAFLDGTARTGNAADTDGHLYDPSGDLIQNAVATTELHSGIYVWTYTLPAEPELGNWVAVVHTTDPTTMDPVTSANTFTVSNTSASNIAASLQAHRDGSAEIMNENFEGYSFGEFTVLLLFLAIFLWGGYTRQLMVSLAGAIGVVLVSITTPDLPVKWLILLGVLAAAVMAIRNSWKANAEERNNAERTV